VPKRASTKALELGHPDEGSVSFHLGQLAEARGRPEQALTWYQSVIKVRQRLDAQLRAAVVMGKLGKTDQALEWLATLSAGRYGRANSGSADRSADLRDAKNYQRRRRNLDQGARKNA
jgi:tetratricopeptide (TPR) repeat protein